MPYKNQLHAIRIMLADPSQEEAADGYESLFELWMKNADSADFIQDLIPIAVEYKNIIHEFETRLGELSLKSSITGTFLKKHLAILASEVAIADKVSDALTAEGYKKKAFEELESGKWVKAETNLSFALDFDPSDDVTRTLLSHLRSLLKAQNLAYQRNSGIWDEKKSLRIDKELQSIIDRTNDTSVLRNLWVQVLETWCPNVNQFHKADIKSPMENSRYKKQNANKTEMHAARIFISYSHIDESLKDEFVTMFAGLQRQGRIDAWQDRRIDPGEEWFTAIQKAMEECNLAVLLVSPDFIASSFIQTEELKLLLQRRIEDGLHIVPIILRPCLWQRESVIKDLQALPKDGKAVISFSKDNGDRDQVWADICKTIEMIAAGS
jgi:hypothetical protein